MAVDAALSADLAIILLSAAAFGFVAKRLGQPTIIAYIVAGVVIGPAALGIVEVGALTNTLSELGLAFLLFLLGIKMRIDEVRPILVPVTKISFPQMAAVGGVGVGLALLLASVPGFDGFTVVEAVIIGLAVMYSSTAVVIKMLNDKDEATSLHGKLDVGILLVQDIVVVIILAVLAAGQPDDLAAVGTTLVLVLTLVAIVTVAAVAASRYLLPRVFRRIADNKDIFFLVALSWAFLFVFVSDEINLFVEPLIGQQAYLSIEMGAFLAGLSIAQLPYSKELQDRVNPLTDLFVMIFFVSVALDMDASELTAYWHEAVVFALVLMIVKFLVFFSLLHWQRFDLETTFLGSINMIQVSEFGIIVAVAAEQGDFVSDEIVGFMTLLALITMSISVFFVASNRALFERVRPWLSRFEIEDGFERDKQDYSNHAVVIGYDGVTKTALSLLSEHYDDVVVVDRRVDHIETLQQGDYDAVYGDFRSSVIRKDVQLKKADFVLSSSVQPVVNRAILREVSDDATVFVEARNATDARDLYDRGADCVLVTEFLAAERLAASLRLYLEDEQAGRKEIAENIELLQSPDPFPDIHDQIRGESDD